MPTGETDFAPGICESCILTRIQTFVRGNPAYAEQGFVLADDPEDLEKVVIQSIYMSELISFLEDEFSIHVSNLEICEENLGSLRSAARFVAGKQPFAVG